MFKRYKKRKFNVTTLIVLFVVLVLLPVILWKYYERKFVLSFVPDALMVNTVRYQEEKSWGFGPGGAEAGIRFYALPEAVAQKIVVGGIKYFEQLPPNQDQQDRGWRGAYEEWRETPIQSAEWKVNQQTGLLNVGEYLCVYECLDVDPMRLQQINEIISKPGSFYARGQIGIIVVSPKERLVVYFYHG